MAINFGQAVGRAKHEIVFAPDILSDKAIMTLGGQASEVIKRNRGRDHRVVPLCPITDDVFAWTGYRELWEKSASEQNFRFIEAGFTLHIGRQGDASKPQILRSEWVGRRNGAFENQAGHPHWQFDALESARIRSTEAPVRFAEGDRPVVEFEAEQKSTAVEDLLLGLTVERMHLASAALWWRQPNMPLAHPAETVADLDRWVLGCVAYIRQELGRCSIMAVSA